ncbi:extensin family protein [Roseinatronobacter sp.]|uniref:extensin-like domain-containing protein n=1 Tax=Roseinatronobacter sp. TaxID=1945755 RepID=UPI0025FD7BA9|nr:extensin family protein [Rhodobaca sp.]
MSRVLIAGLGLLVLVLAGCSSDRSADRSSRAVAYSPGPQQDRGGLLSRLNPFQNAAFRSNPSRAVTSPRASNRLCGIRGLTGEVIPPITSQVAGCGVAAPVRVTQVDGVSLSQGAIMDCETAAALHRWVRQGVKPAVGRSGGGVTGLQVAAHYVCRPRNHRSGARVSEHGRGRAIDISAIQLADGTEMSVLRDWHDSQHARALQQMHRAACGTFGTTLGPGSDGMHEDHFHYDTARHRGGGYCR